MNASTSDMRTKSTYPYKLIPSHADGQKPPAQLLQAR